MSIGKAVVGANTASDSLETAAHAIEALLSGTPEDRNKPKAATTPATEVVAEPVAEATPVEGDTSAAEEIETPVADEGAEPVQPRKLKVKTPEGEEELSEDEVVKGYMRQKDYTRKTQEAATLRKQDEAERTAVKAERVRYAEELTKLHDAIVATTPQEPDWDKLRATADPAEFAQAWSQWDAHKAGLKTLQDEQERAVAKVMEDKRTEYEQYVSGEREKLFEAVPEWKDEKVRSTERRAIGDFAVSELGFTPEQLEKVDDHRAMRVLRLAYLYVKGQKDAKAAAVKAAGNVDPHRVIAPKGAAPKHTPTAKRAEAMKNLRKTGSVEDAAAALRALDG